MLRLCLSLGTACLLGASVATAAGTADLPMLEKRWHKCVRQSFSGQPLSVPKRTAEIAALSECKPAEDAYVAAVLAAQSAEAEARRRGADSLGARARAWASSVLSYVAGPLSGWFGSRDP